MLFAVCYVGSDGRALHVHFFLYECTVFLPRNLTLLTLRYPSLALLIFHGLAYLCGPIFMPLPSGFMP
jgi:hypothetical protein